VHLIEATKLCSKLVAISPKAETIRSTSSCAPTTGSPLVVVVPVAGGPGAESAAGFEAAPDERAAVERRAAAVASTLREAVTRSRYLVREIAWRCGPTSGWLWPPGTGPMCPNSSGGPP